MAKDSKNSSGFAAFLRGINVTGHHKVPMAELRRVMENLGYTNVRTLLNSGNIVFNGIATSNADLEKTLAENLEKEFGFPIPVLVRKSDEIQHLISSDPFRDVIVTPDIRLYVIFMKKNSPTDLVLPWISADGSFQILKNISHAVCGVVDLSRNSTPEAMKIIEKFYGKEITTRSWNTLLKTAKLLESI